MEAAAWCGLTEEEFWFCTPAWFYAKQEATVKHTQTQWEMHRLTAYYAFVGHPRKRVPKITELVRFPWEKVKRIQATKADLDNLKKFEQTDHSDLFAMLEKQLQNGG